MCPLVTDASGRRLAKREADLSLAELRAGGTDPARNRGLGSAQRRYSGERPRDGRGGHARIPTRRLARTARLARSRAADGAEECSLSRVRALLQQTALGIERDQQGFFAAGRHFLVFRQRTHEPGVRALRVASNGDTQG